MPRPCRIIISVLLSAISFSVLFCALAFLFPQQALTVDSGDVKADAIVVLGGGADQLRPERAAELFKQGKASAIVVSGYGDDVMTEHLLSENGVPDAAMQIENASKSTYENAINSIPILHQLGAHRVILVTSWYHSRRALACFRHLAPDLEFYSCPSYWGYPSNEWGPRGLRGYIDAEYLKMLGYGLVYGIWPYWP